MQKEKISGVLYVSSKEGFKTYTWTDLEGNALTDRPYIAGADHSFVLDVLKRATGKILTVVEASYSDKEQRKAMKDIVKSMFSDEMEYITDMLYSPKKLAEFNEMANEFFEGKTEEEIAKSAVDVEDIIKA